MYFIKEFICKICMYIAEVAPRFLTSAESSALEVENKDCFVVNYIILAVFFIGILGLIVILFLKRYFQEVPIIIQKSISVSDIVDFFNQENLFENPENAGVVMKQNIKKGKIELRLAVLNLKNKKISSPIKIFHVEELSRKLEEDFGGKDMIVLSDVIEGFDNKDEIIPEK